MTECHKHRSTEAQAQAQKHKHNKHTNLSVTSTLSHLANIWLFCGWFVRAGTFWIMESKLAKHCQSTIVLGKGFFRRKTNVVFCHQCWNWFHNTIVLAKGFFRRKNCHRCWIVRGRSAAECSRWSCDTTSCELILFILGFKCKYFYNIFSIKFLKRKSYKFKHSKWTLHLPPLWGSTTRIWKKSCGKYT